MRGSAQFASLGYWIDKEFAGRGIMPRAVAMAIDHCFFTAGLHRVEIAIRPENSNSLRVVEKLDIHEVGFAPKFLHIDGAWRDHRIYAITVEECPEGMLVPPLTPTKWQFLRPSFTPVTRVVLRHTCGHPTRHRLANLTSDPWTSAR